MSVGGVVLCLIATAFVFYRVGRALNRARPTHEEK